MISDRSSWGYILLGRPLVEGADDLGWVYYAHFGVNWKNNLYR